MKILPLGWHASAAEILAGRLSEQEEEIPALKRAGITICYLPSYTPELSRIEPIWYAVKHHELTERSHTTVRSLKRATEEALARKAADLLTARSETENLLRRGA